MSLGRSPTSSPLLSSSSSSKGLYGFFSLHRWRETSHRNGHQQHQVRPPAVDTTGTMVSHTPPFEALKETDVNEEHFAAVYLSAYKECGHKYNAMRYTFKFKVTTYSLHSVAYTVLYRRLLQSPGIPFVPRLCRHI